jgi:hypothetical protein
VTTEDYFLHFSRKATQHIHVTPAEMVLMLDAVHNLAEYLCTYEDMRNMLDSRDKFRECFLEVNGDELADQLYAILYLVMKINDENRGTP